MPSRTTPCSCFVRASSLLASQRLRPLTMSDADSGHGKQIQNVDGSEADGMDEVICPVDFDEEGYIEDDVRLPHVNDLAFLTLSVFLQYLKELVVDPLPAGCRLTVIFDVRSCSWLSAY